MSGWPTSRRHSRALAEAFPAERAQCIEHYAVPHADRWAGIALAIAIGVSLVLAVLWRL